MTQDSAVGLECRAEGRPPPQISWLKNGQPLLLSPHIQLLSSDSVLRSVLMIQVTADTTDILEAVFCTDFFI